MRTINVAEHELLLDDDVAASFIKADLLYECGDEPGTHDLHLNPEHEWKLHDVEALLTAVWHK